MTRLLLISLSIVGLWAIFAAPAGAQKLYDPQCGLNPDKYTSTVTLRFGDDGWTGTWNQNCGQSDSSVEVELQRSQDGGAHWQTTVSSGDLQNFLLGTPASLANDDVTRVVGFDGGCGDGLYRFKVWDYNSSSRTAARGDFC